MSDRVRIEPSQKRVRAYLGGRVVADSTAARLVWEKPYYPTYYFPTADVDMDLLIATGETTRSPSRGPGHLYTVKVNGTEAQDAARIHAESPVEELRELVTFDWAAMDAWFEEDEQVYVHARDPYTRVDILSSSRAVRVEIDGETVAETTNAKFLFETGLPVRYYIPKTDVRMDLLTATELHTECPYKGVASYYSVTVGDTDHENVVWWYPFPTAESAEVASLVSFYNEKVDIFVDGEPEERPKTVFS